MRSIVVKWSRVRQLRRYGLLVMWMLALGANACGGESASTGPSAVPQIAGQWSFTETFSESRVGLMCNNRAAITVAQAGVTFTATSVQTGSCTDASGTFDNSGTFQLLDGKIDQSSVSWRDDGEPVCRYTGNMTGSPPARMAGSVQCAGVVNGITLDSRGTWEMTR